MAVELDDAVADGDVALVLLAEDTEKGGVAAFTVCLAKELGEHGIAANSINPGAIDTPMYRKWLEQHAERGGPSPEERHRRAAASQFRGRIGRPEDVGHVAVLLLSAEGEWITGEAFTVRGGPG